ncbi:MAG: hypothetical protein RIS47_85, partial [Bacteroidota bacterium]
MKLITKINLNFLSSAMVVLFVGGTAFYFLVQYIAVQHVDIQLRAVYRDSQHQIDSLAELPQPLTLQGNMVQIDRIVTHKKTD